MLILVKGLGQLRPLPAGAWRGLGVRRNLHVTALCQFPHTHTHARTHARARLRIACGFWPSQDVLARRRGKLAGKSSLMNLSFIGLVRCFQLSLWVVGRWLVEIPSPETSELGFSCWIHMPRPLADQWWLLPHPWPLGGIGDSPRLAPSSVAPVCSWQCGHFPVVTLLCWDTGIPEATLSRLELRAGSGETELQANQHLSLRNHLFALQPLLIDWSWGPA